MVIDKIIERGMSERETEMMMNESVCEKDDDDDMCIDCDVMMILMMM
jgi:hypothetical protein